MPRKQEEYNGKQVGSKQDVERKTQYNDKHDYEGKQESGICWIGRAVRIVSSISL